VLTQACAAKVRSLGLATITDELRESVLWTMRVVLIVNAACAVDSVVARQVASAT